MEKQLIKAEAKTLFTNLKENLKKQVEDKQSLAESEMEQTLDKIAQAIVEKKKNDLQEVE